MSAPFLPETAPFTSSQRAWLNGFFAGMSSTQAAAPTTPVAAAAAAALSSAPTVEAEPEDFPWHDPAMPMDERLKLAEGKPASRRLMAAMAQLDCGSCGYVCQTYAEAIASGAEADLTRCTPGGKETAARLRQVVKESPVVQVTVKATSAPVPAAKTAHDRNHPFAARVLVNRKLNGDGSSKDTRLVAFDLRNSGLGYKPGDALGVMPKNCPDIVDDLLRALNATGAEDVPAADGTTHSLRHVLTEQRSVTRSTEQLFDLLSEASTNADHKAALHRMATGEDTSADDLQILDVLERFPSARPDAVELARTLSVLQPRLYSIASSLAAHPDQVHLTVGVVRYQNSVGRACGGVCSTFLADRLAPGDSVKVFIHPSRSFGLPISSNNPIIMVGPGTGIAPFRAFLHDRKATGATGKNWLFFGDQHAACDFLFRDELEGFRADGLLSRLDVAFSRDQDEKLYVQHRMLEHGKELFAWLEQGAHFYVCGDARRMASDVDKALRAVVATHGAMTPEQADAYVSELVKTGRYQRDVY